MVKNRPNSLRGSASVMSLRSEIQEDAASRRIAELEAQVELLRKASVAPSSLLQHRNESCPNIPYKPADGTYAVDGSSFVESYRRANGTNSWRTVIPQQNVTPTKRSAGLSTMYQEFADMMKTHAPEPEHALKAPEAYTEPFCTFLTTNPTVWHAVDYFETKLQKAGFKKVCPPRPVAELVSC
jgi:hypothetical protein